MPRPYAAIVPPQNQILARLPKAEYQRLLANLKPVSLRFRQVLYKARTPIDYVYFPTATTVSAVARMNDGRIIEVASVGNEGVVGHSLAFGGRTMPYEVIVQVPGEGFGMRPGAFVEEATRDGPLRRLLVRYHSAFIVQALQSVACNGLHSVHQRCCRWLLMTQDRSRSDEFMLTHEFLALMLGVRRPSVTEVLQPLKDAGFIRTGRGRITVVDRRGMEECACECYRVVKDEFDRLHH